MSCTIRRKKWGLNVAKLQKDTIYDKKLLDLLLSCSENHISKIPSQHVQLKLMYKNCAYFEYSGPNWSKLGSFGDKHHILHVIDLILG